MTIFLKIVLPVDRVDQDWDDELIYAPLNL